MTPNDWSNREKILVGGVNSPVRAFRNVGLSPLLVKKAEGKYLIAENDKQYLDFCMSWGVNILGHNAPVIINAVQQALQAGLSFGFSHSKEEELAKAIIECYPSIEKIRFVNSGTEAAMTAIRLARGFTGRNKILKFDGCYHGHSDCLLATAGSGVSELPSASSKGVPDDMIQHTLSIPFNNKELFEKTVQKYHADLACVVLEVVPGNMGLVLPDIDFLETVRKETARHGVVLIFDEVITGFRAGLGGAQAYFNIKPDMTLLGKIIGGGLPIGAFGGKQEIMDCLAPLGGVYQAGTFSGNPIVMSAGLAVIQTLKKNQSLYSKMSENVEVFAKEFRKISKLTLNTFCSQFTIFFTTKPVNNFQNALKQDKNLFLKFYQQMVAENILFPPSMFESSFISCEHQMNDFDRLLKVIKNFVF